MKTPIPAGSQGPSFLRLLCSNAVVVRQTLGFKSSSRNPEGGEWQPRLAERVQREVIVHNYIQFEDGISSFQHSRPS